MIHKSSLKIKEFMPALALLAFRVLQSGETLILDLSANVKVVLVPAVGDYHGCEE